MKRLNVPSKGVSMKIRIEINKEALVGLIADHINEQMGDGDFGFNLQDIKIETKSRQSYRSEWESADFRAVLETNW